MASLLALLKSPFTRRVGEMVAYTALGQSVYLLTGPLIGRLYSPAEFGLYGLFYTFAITAIGVIFLNYDFAIPAAASDNEAWALTRGAFGIALALTPLVGIIMGALIAADVGGFGSLPIAAAILLMAFLLMQAIVQLLQNWNVRRQQAVLIGKASVTLNVVRGGVQVTLGAFLPSWWMLAAGEVAGRVANAVHLARMARSDAVSVRVLAPRLDGETRGALRRHREFPIVLLPAQLIDSAVALLQTTGLAYLFGASGLGIFFLMRRTLDMPVAFAFRSLSDIFYARLAHDARNSPERVRPFFVRSVLLIAAIGLIPAVPAMLLGPALFAFVFGPEWREAGVLAAIMTPAAIANLAVAPVSRVFALTTRPYLRYWFSVVNLVGSALALVCAQTWSLDLIATTACIAIATFAAYLAYFFAGYAASASLRHGDDQALVPKASHL